MIWTQNLRNKAKNDFEKDFFKLMVNAVLGKTMENMRKHRHIKLITTERRRNYFVSEPIYYATMFLIKYLLAIEIGKKSEIIMNKPVYLGLLILGLTTILMYEFWCVYVKLKDVEKQNCIIWI